MKTSQHYYETYTHLREDGYTDGSDQGGHSDHIVWMDDSSESTIAVTTFTHAELPPLYLADDQGGQFAVFSSYDEAYESAVQLAVHLSTFPGCVRFENASDRRIPAKKHHADQKRAW